MITPIEVDTDTYNLALYYIGLTEPMLWDEQVTITFSNGTCTFTNSGQEYTFTYDTIYYKTDDGDYVYADADGAYVLSDTPILAWKRPGQDGLIEVKGTDDDGYESVDIIEGAVSSVGDPVVGLEETEYEGLYTLSSVKVNVDGTDLVFNKVIVPKSIRIGTDEPVVIDKAPVNAAGWFKFRRRTVTVPYQTGGVVLPGSRIREILGIQAAGIVSYEFDRESQTVKMYKSANSECDNKKYTLAILYIAE